MTDTIKLPAPDERGGPPLSVVLARRRSVREFTSRELSLSEMGQLLWAAQGVTDQAERLRAAPSAGALYPLELDVVTPSGVFRFQPADHVIVRRVAKDARASLARAALGQDCVSSAPCVIAICAVAARTTRKYGSRGLRYVHVEAGHAAQNILLMAGALGLAGVPVGAFDDAAVARALQLARDEAPIYLVPVGWPKGTSLARFPASG